MTIFSSKPHNFSAKLKPNLYQGLDHMSALFLRRLGQLSTLSMVEVAYVRIHYIIEVSKWARIKSKFSSVQISNRQSISHFPSHVTVGFILSDEIEFLAHSDKKNLWSKKSNVHRSLIFDQIKRWQCFPRIFSSQDSSDFSL